MIADAELDEADLDEHLLRNWILTQDGIETMLNRREYLPMSAGSVTLCYSYEELDGIFVFPDLIAQGYQLVTVSEMLTYNSEALELGKVYFGK